MFELSIRGRQVEAAKAMIALNSSDWKPDWKFLIYDTIGENILAPLFTVIELEDSNVVKHLLISSRQKDPIPDVTAVYFVMPTDENIDRICEDLTNRLYDSYYLNFISPISRSKLETIADAALISNTASQVKKVYDQYLNFIALEDDLFILREDNRETVSFHAINRSDSNDSSAIDNIVDGLFSVLVTLNIIPIIRCPKGSAAEVISEKLTKKIRDTLRDTKSGLFDNKANKSSGSTMGLSFQRPLLCLVDRSVDIGTPLHHTWTYQALIHDLFNTKLNKVNVETNWFDLNPGDKFWRGQRGCPFPQVAEAVQKELDEYKRNEDRVKIDSNEIDSLAESTAKLINAASSLPELYEHKRVIGNHTTIAHAVLDEIKARKLDNFFEIEEKIMNRNLIDRVTLDDMLANPGYGNPSDKYRLFLISYICDNPNLTDDESEKYMSILEELGCKRDAYEYVKRWKTFSRIGVESLQSNLQSGGGGILKTAGMFSKLMSQGSQFVMEGVKNLVLREHHLPLTKIVDGLMDSTSKVSQESQEYCYFDPKAQKDTEVQRKKAFNNAIVFVVGGGNYIEYQNIVDYCKSKSASSSGPMGARQIVYGSTDLLNSEQFLRELHLLH